ncbi:MAG: hypothetical protein A2W33_06500 [Chloroflexi bacterium RBG_16_52_11]|nr:MAG: hypothetical protein A2W33_06500 [Chloroflexi bacterium RBG_16_52_11]
MDNHLSSTKQEIHPETSGSENKFVRNVLVKATILFLVTNLLFMIKDPLPSLGRLSLYNQIFPGRQRLPYGDNPDRSYNLTLNNLAAMFASHELAVGNKPDDEYRVILVGDSATWGYLQKPEQTLSAQISQLGVILPDGRRVRAYNLGYPVMSMMKDLLILSHAVSYEPDLIVWLVTLESFPNDKQLYPPLLQNNLQPVRELIDTYDLALDTGDPNFTRDLVVDRTIIGRRRELADLLRLQIYGVMWTATGIDQDITGYTPVSQDLAPDEGFHDLNPPHLKKEDLALQIVDAGMEIAGNTPVILINEPIFISSGENSHIRYNFYYPRWAYDDYRQILSRVASENDWIYNDLWDLILPREFTNTAIHLTLEGVSQFAAQVSLLISKVATLSH